MHGKPLSGSALLSASLVSLASAVGAGTLPPPVMLPEIEAADVAPPSDLALGGDAIYFSGPGPERWQAWTLRDGQAAPLGAPCPTGGAGLGSYVILPGTAVGFISEHCHFSGTFLGSIDRLTGTTQPVDREDESSVHGLTRFGKNALFTDVNGKLWVTDGTTAGTLPVSDLAGGGHITSAGDWAVLGGYGGPWRTDGTARGTFQLSAEVAPEALPAPWPSESFPPMFVPVDERILFYGRSAAEGLELWSTDGTAVGTVRLTTFRPGNGVVSVGAIQRCGRVAYFGSDGITPAGEEYWPYLWRSDGTIGGTYPMGEWTPAGWRGLSASPVGCLGSSLVALVRDLEKDTQRLEILDGGSADISPLLEVGHNVDVGYPAFEYHGWLFFSLAFGDEGYGRELWATNGTAAGTFRTGEIAPGNGDANPHSMTALGDSLYFLATDPIHDQEIWRIVVDPNLLFRDGFESATLTAWNQPATE